MNPTELANETMKVYYPEKWETVNPDGLTLNPMTCENTGLPARGNWWNWVPKNAVETMKTADSQVDCLMDLVYHTLSRWEDQYAAAEGIYVDELDSQLLYGAIRAVSRRVYQGASTELAAAEAIDGRILSTEEALEVTGYDSIQQMENAGIDMVSTDGTTFQVKSSTEVRDDKDKKEADVMVWVIVDSDGDIVRVEA